MVAPIEHDGVVGQAVFLQLAEDLADLAVHVGDVVVHPRELFADGGAVRVVGRHLDLRRVGHERLALARRARRKDLALVRDLEVEHREERLALVGAIAPVRLVAQSSQIVNGVPNW